MMHQNAELEDFARKLEESGNYRILRRLTPREATPTPSGYSGKFGIVIDFETTGLNAAKDEIIEVAMVKFRYSDTYEITGISDTFQSFNQPSNPIPAEVVALTGITDDVVAGRKIDGAELEAFIKDVDIIIAHNASFDRKFAEQSWQFFEHKPWACSIADIKWQEHGSDGAKLGYLLSGAGFFHEAHRAIDDCHALVEILARSLPSTSRPALATLMSSATLATTRIWAENAPFELKDNLKARGYRWNDGSDGSARSWFIDVEKDKRDVELNYLKNEIYQRNVDLNYREMTALDRFSNRV